VNNRRGVPGHSTVLDREGLSAIFDYLSGRTLLGAVDCGDCVELVFTLDDAGQGANLVTVFTDDRWRGSVALGGVAHPADYVRAVRGDA
jgi:hypothetical protein